MEWLRAPLKTIWRAIKPPFFRILIFFCLIVSSLGLWVSYIPEDLLSSNSCILVGACVPPFVKAVKLPGFKTLPGVIDGVLLYSSFQVKLRIPA